MSEPSPTTPAATAAATARAIADLPEADEAAALLPEADSGPGRHVAHFYRIRIATTLAGLGVGLYYVLQFGQFTAYHAAVFTLGLAYPHIAYFLQARLELGRRVEHATLAVDAFVGGSVVYMLGFSLLPSTAMVLITLINPVAFTGFGLLGWTTLSMAAGVGLPTWLIGAHFAPRDVAVINIAAVAFLFGYYALFAHAVYLRTIALQRSRRELRQQRVALEIGKKRSDALLLSLMPPAAAAQFERDGTVPARRIDGAGLLFVELSGLIGQVGQAGAATPGAALAEVNVIAQSVDAICARHGLYGVQALGEAYVAVAGIEHDSDAAHQAARTLAAAREIRRFADAHDESRRARQLPPSVCRIAVHCGPVIAGVVELRKVGYGVVGETVTEALALGRAAPDGVIAVSKSTADLARVSGPPLPPVALASGGQLRALALAVTVAAAPSSASPLATTSATTSPSPSTSPQASAPAAPGGKA